MAALYDTIGINYTELRRPDPRIATFVLEALANADSVLNVGAGTGSYEPDDRELVAVEPSQRMIAKRSSGDVPVVQAVSEQLPFQEDAFDASMGVLTVHHWANKEAGLREMRRVTRGPVVLLTFDPAVRPWLTDYLPELATLDQAQMPPMEVYPRCLGAVDVIEVPIPHDCVDGFLYAYWRRPEAYFDERIRSGISSFWRLENVEAGLQLLKQDLETGEWQQRYHHLLALDGYDAGYRLVVTR